MQNMNKPTKAFRIASLAALIVGVGAYFIGLYNAPMAYFLASAVATGSAIVLLVIGLLNAELLLSEKGFFGMAFTLSLFAAITVQKNVRDSQTTDESCQTKSDTQSSDTEHEDTTKIEAA